MVTLIFLNLFFSLFPLNKFLYIFLIVLDLILYLFINVLMADQLRLAKAPIP